MALDLHISGPGLDVHRRLQPGEPPLVLGRDADCSVCLQDPERNVSRRHLSVWNEGDQLHFQVLSAVNGVDTAAGEVPPGARSVLGPGEVLGLSAYRLVVAPVVPAGVPGDADPWAEFERQAATLVPDGVETVPAGPEGDDPFGDWGFHSTFGPGAPGGSLSADALQPAGDLGPFLQGLGLRGSAGFTQGELETIGRLTRIAVQGLLQAVHDAAVARQEVPPDDHTQPEPRDPNPLRRDLPLEAKLQYLFGGQAAAAGLLPPDRALAQMVTELAAHQQATSEAMREAMRSLLDEFDPETLKKRLLGGSPRLFESARAWDAFSRDYAERRAAADEWLGDLLDRHFARAYARALVRAKRNTPGRKGP